MGGKRLGLAKAKGGKKLPKIVRKGDSKLQMAARLQQAWFRTQANFNADTQAVFHRIGSKIFP